jgi:hypothetical protein
MPNWENMPNEAVPNTAEMQAPWNLESLPVGIGLFCVRFISLSYGASITWFIAWVEHAIKTNYILQAPDTTSAAWKKVGAGHP